MTGIQLGFVVGPAGEEIFCDKYGRVKVQFHWDREGAENADSSCWLRVSNSWGGPGWGGNFVPHVGQEVMISYEEGDPDRPMIVGRLYNAEQMPPLGLPGNKTKSILRDQGNNQIMMEGEGGAQQVIVYSPESGAILCMGAKPPGIIPEASDQGTGSGGGAGRGGFVVPPRLDLTGIMTAEKLAGFHVRSQAGNRRRRPRLCLPTCLPTRFGRFRRRWRPQSAAPTPPRPPRIWSGCNDYPRTDPFLCRRRIRQGGACNHHEVTIKDVFSTILGNQSKLVKATTASIFSDSTGRQPWAEGGVHRGFKTEVTHGNFTSCFAEPGWR